MKSLYETDFVLWTERNAELLRSGRLAEAECPFSVNDVIGEPG